MRRIVCFSFFMYLIYMNIAQASSLPVYDIDASCKEIAEFAGGDKKIELDCRNNEQEARAALAKMDIPEQVLKSCTQDISSDEKNYVMLQYCADDAVEKASNPHAEEKTRQLRTQVQELFAELNSFKNTDIFKKCIYGCNQENPGQAWNQKRQALQDKMTPEVKAPVMLKAVPANLWSLGMAYAKGKTSDIQWFRSQVEEGLAAR